MASADGQRDHRIRSPANAFSSEEPRETQYNPNNSPPVKPTLFGDGPYEDDDDEAEAGPSTSADAET